MDSLIGSRNANIKLKIWNQEEGIIYATIPTNFIFNSTGIIITDINIESNLDCNGVYDGLAISDDCGICNGFNKDIDGCGICGGDNSSCNNPINTELLYINE